MPLNGYGGWTVSEFINIGDMACSIKAKLKLYDRLIGIIYVNDVSLANIDNTWSYKIVLEGLPGDEVTPILLQVDETNCITTTKYFNEDLLITTFLQQLANFIVDNFSN